jgi:hypothetical protein
MDYSQHQFLNLIEAVEDAGGANLPDPCMPEDIVYEVATKTNKRTRVHVDSTGCGHTARFAVPYDPTAEVQIPLDKDKDPGNLVRDRQVVVDLHMGLDQVTEEEAARLKAFDAGIVTACAVDDNMGQWPRFRDQTFAENF